MSSAPAVPFRNAGYQRESSGQAMPGHGPISFGRVAASSPKTAVSSALAAW